MFRLFKRDESNRCLGCHGCCFRRIIVFDISSAISAMYVECEENGKRRRVLLCPDEWNGSFGEEFYDFIIQNDFYYIKANIMWNSQSTASPISNGLDLELPDSQSLAASVEKLRSLNLESE